MSKKLLTFVHISDSHIHADPDYTGELIDFSSRQPVQKLVETINNLEAEVDFVLHTGDVAQNPQTEEHYTASSAILSQIRYPVYYIPGNHDRVDMFQRAFLHKPEDAIVEHYDYQFAHNGVQIVMVDSHALAGEKTATGFLAESQLQWLDEICSSDDDRPLVVALHHHAIPLEAPWLDEIILTNGLDVHRILVKAKHRLRGVFYGHIHENVVTVRDGISYYSALSSWFQTRTWYAADGPARDWVHNPGFNLVTLTETDTFIRFWRISL